MIWPRRTFLVVLLTTILLSTVNLNGEENSSSSNSSSTTEEPTPSTSSEPTTILSSEENDDDTENQPEQTPPSTREQHGSPLQGPSEADIVEENNKICLAVKLDAMLALKKKDGTIAEHTSLLESHKTSGTCSDETGEYGITLLWKDFNLTLVAVADKVDSDWQMTIMKLHFNPSDFFNDKDEGILKVLHAKPSDLEIFSAPINQSVSCANTKVIELYNDEDISSGSIIINDFGMQIYNVSSTFAPSKSCDQQTAEPVVQTQRYQSDTAPIAVGSTLAIVTLAVITGYAIYRSLTNKKVDYGNIGE